jgi:hypothetical protein
MTKEFHGSLSSGGIECHAILCHQVAFNAMYFFWSSGGIECHVIFMTGGIECNVISMSSGGIECT